MKIKLYTEYKKYLWYFYCTKIFWILDRLALLPNCNKSFGRVLNVFYFLKT